MFEAIILAEFISMLFYTFIGMLLLWIAYKIIDIVTPFPIIKEIEEDQNTSLAVLIGSVFLSMSIIIAAVILS
jgi:putative membrane protein